MIKIKEYKVGKRGLRGAVLSLPKIFVDDNDLGPGDVLEIFRDNEVTGKDALIIIPKNSNKIVERNISTVG
ncbi:MAG: hypothetical protein CVV23_15755 [Ignavibacteriae bacterium HGW-Ignavibacteriae-2]|jgi:hypothetical protein|nr:MAG: hypothetical protein CVV23_15755 [Ignavibacteriae bacterium HGW-Ignavibacteriae-2]